MNERKFYLNGLVKNFILLMLNGSVIQMFLAECGIPEQNITFYVSLMQIVQQVALDFYFKQKGDEVVVTVPEIKQNNNGKKRKNRK